VSRGKILLVGIGPGRLEHMTGRARETIAEADVVIGYTRYVQLLDGLLDGKEVVAKPMTAELERAADALAQARAGRIVALVSSGDAGIYGMAAPTYEHLLDSGWRPGDGVDVELIPGCTALSSCAALVGAPLGHDFCAISLSDLLTPWPTIARRLEAAAHADFVVALYNPKSGRRSRHILEACRILLQHRSPDTPTAVVHAAYRPEQRIQLTTLGSVERSDLGMLSTLLIGNSNTSIREGLMLTPRGYTAKYSGADGRAREGERRGRSLSTGLEGWLTEVRERRRSGAEIEELAAAYDLSEEYLTGVLSESESSCDPSEQGTVEEIQIRGEPMRGATSSQRAIPAEGWMTGPDGSPRFSEAERAGVYLRLPDDGSDGGSPVGHPPYALEHGGRLRQASAQYGIPLADWLDLSTGINPNGWPVPPISAAAWSHLPEEEDGLLEAAQTYYGTPSLLPVAGSQAAIQALPRLRPPGRVGIPAPGYAEHGKAWLAAGHRVVPFDPRTGPPDGLDVILLIHPNNPTGQTYAPDRLLAWHRRLAERDGWLVVDEAFIDATPTLSLAIQGPLQGLVVLRSLGKFFGLAGARVGFVLAHEDLLQIVGWGEERTPTSCIYVSYLLGLASSPQPTWNKS